MARSPRQWVWIPGNGNGKGVGADPAIPEEPGKALGHTKQRRQPACRGLYR